MWASSNSGQQLSAAAVRLRYAHKPPPPLASASICHTQCADCSFYAQSVQLCCSSSSTRESSESLAAVSDHVPVRPEQRLIYEQRCGERALCHAIGEPAVASEPLQLMIRLSEALWLLLRVL